VAARRGKSRQDGQPVAGYPNRFGGRSGIAAGTSLNHAAAAIISPRFDSALGSALAFVLDQIPVGVVLVDESGRVVWMNRNAVTLISDGDGITLRDGRLEATSNGATPALDRLVEHAVASSQSGEARDPETIVLPRPSKAGSLVVVVRPVDRPGAGGAKRAAKAVIFVSEPKHGLRTSRQRLRILFDLTLAESNLVALLAEGLSLREAASQLGITSESARTYLKRAFEKTGTRRQAELVRLALAAATAGAGDS